MNSFLITFKPATENPERGWPIENLRQLCKLLVEGKPAIEPWRFSNRSTVSIGDRVFLILQGRRGPALIGFGSTVEEPRLADGRWVVPVSFEALTDPDSEVIAAKNELLAIPGGEYAWRSQASGILLDPSVALALESLSTAYQLGRAEPDSPSNPDWTRDELIVALDFYLQHRPNPPAKGTHEIAALSESLRRLGRALFGRSTISDTFRNENSVYMKLMNFRSIDPAYTRDGKIGLVRGAKADEEVWSEFASDPKRCTQTAQSIVGISSGDVAGIGTLDREMNDEITEAPEGRLLTRLHVIRERDRRLVETKRSQAIKKFGKLFCEACNFDFERFYGQHGRDFIECHHTRPISGYKTDEKTRVEDLALVCSNCHRMIHRTKKWLTLDELRSRIRSVAPTVR